MQYFKFRDNWSTINFINTFFREYYGKVGIDINTNNAGKNISLKFFELMQMNNNRRDLRKSNS